MITGTTQNLGVIGWPIAHSLSPVLQNAAIDKSNLDYNYTALPVQPEDLPAAVAGLKALHYRGWNVTIPHKRAIMPLLDEIDEDAAVIGAWEHGPEPQYVPKRTAAANPFVSPDQMDRLRRHVRRSLEEMAEEIRRGSIEVRPAYVSENDNACRTCQYHSICRFEEGENGDTSRVTPHLKDEEVWERLGEEDR